MWGSRPGPSRSPPSPASTSSGAATPAASSPPTKIRERRRRARWVRTRPMTSLRSRVGTGSTGGVSLKRERTLSSVLIEVLSQALPKEAPGMCQVGPDRALPTLHQFRDRRHRQVEPVVEDHRDPLGLRQPPNLAPQIDHGVRIRLCRLSRRGYPAAAQGPTCHVHRGRVDPTGRPCLPPEAFPPLEGSGEGLLRGILGHGPVPAQQVDRGEDGPPFGPIELLEPRVDIHAATLADFKSRCQRNADTLGDVNREAVGGSLTTGSGPRENDPNNKEDWPWSGSVISSAGRWFPES